MAATDGELMAAQASAAETSEAVDAAAVPYISISMLWRKVSQLNSNVLIYFFSWSSSRSRNEHGRGHTTALWFVQVPHSFSSLNTPAPKTFLMFCRHAPTLREVVDPSQDYGHVLESDVLTAQWLVCIVRRATWNCLSSGDVRRSAVRRNKSCD